MGSVGSVDFDNEVMRIEPGPLQDRECIDGEGVARSGAAAQDAFDHLDGLRGVVDTVEKHRELVAA
jgi:hypothetical protein